MKAADSPTILYGSMPINFSEEFIMEILLLPLIILSILVLPVYAAIKKFKSPQKARAALIANLCCFFAVFALAVFLPVGQYFNASAASDESSASEEAGNESEASGLGYIAAALATGLGSIGCGIAVGGAAPAAIGATAEEPKSFSKSLIFVALGEGVALYGFLISFMILQKL